MDARLVTCMIFNAFRRAYEDKFIEKISDDTIFVSEVTYCIRKAYLLRRDPRPFNREKLVILVWGSLAHFLVENYIDYDGVLCEKSVSVDLGGFKLKGRADIIIDDYIVELKTAYSLPDKPFNHHVLQLQAYLWMLDREEGFLVYIARRAGGIVSFKIERDVKYWIEIVDRARKLHEHLKKNEIPPPEKSPLCKFCEYKEYCLPLLQKVRVR